MKSSDGNESLQISGQLNMEMGRKQEYQEEEINSERVTEQIEDDITSLRKKMNQTPLSFYLKLQSSYLISFKKSLLFMHIIKTAVLVILEVSLAIFIYYVLSIPEAFKQFIITLVATNLLTFLLLFFVDPGTLFEDQEQQIQKQRHFCQTCRIYRYDGTHHCVYCVKCIKGYDHHCSFFGKCIGRRNYIMFCVFLLSIGSCGMFSMGSLIYSLVFSH